MRQWWTRLARIASSLLCAGILYFLWMAVFLLTMDFRGRFVEIIIWIAAPIVTGTGFALGVTLFDRLTGVRDSRRHSTFWWPVVGCSLGAGAVYSFGPMLIVFGMFVTGAASVVILESIKASPRNGRAT